MKNDLPQRRGRPSLVERAAERFALVDTSAPARDLPLSPEPPVEPEGNQPPRGAEDSPPRSARRSAKLDIDACQDLGVCWPGAEVGADAERTTEEVRIIKRSVLRTCERLRNETAKNADLVMVASAASNEGKTFTAMGLATSLAQEQDLSVLLIDADFQNTAISRLFSLEEEPGLIGALASDESDVADFLFDTDIERLSVIPAGRAHPRSAELLASKRMAKILSDLQCWRPGMIVIFDAPPVLASSEADILAGAVGQVVFVIEADRTNKTTAVEAIGHLRACKEIGVVLNKVRNQLGFAGFGSGYGYASGKRRS